MPTLAQRWMEQGEKSGIQQGIQQGVQRKADEAVLEVLEARFGLVPQSIAQGVEQVTQEAVLTMLLKRAVIVESLEEFHGDLQRALT